jgi:hypothetical protein
VFFLCGEGVSFLEFVSGLQLRCHSWSHRVVDPDPDSETLWIRIRIGNLDPGARKLRNISGKVHFLVIF